ncbi:MAG: carboxylating nicotinate-nucleotide diphosphorylase [Planctomycetia bacterium]
MSSLEEPTIPARDRLPAARRGLPAPLELAVIDAAVRPALAEDRALAGPDGRVDVTTLHAVPARSRARATLVAKRPGVMAGMAVFLRAFELCDPASTRRALVQDGDAFARGAKLAEIEGSARALLSAERTALNFVQRLCGVATSTARHVLVAHEAGMRPVRILDTRKTTPNLRELEKHAVRCGGGENHRFALHDEAMVKENHIELAGRPIPLVLRDLRAALGPGVRITCEARDEGEARAAVEGGADVVLLDNLPPEEMRRLCPLLREQAAASGRVVELEASGGIDESSLRSVAVCGVDRISIGALTHSAPALDLSLDLAPLASEDGS